MIKGVNPLGGDRPTGPHIGLPLQSRAEHNSETLEDLRQEGGNLGTDVPPGEGSNLPQTHSGTHTGARCGNVGRVEVGTERKDPSLPLSKISLGNILFPILRFNLHSGLRRGEPRPGGPRPPLFKRGYVKVHWKKTVCGGNSLVTMLF